MNQRRAARFRRKKKRLIKLIDTCGAETILQQGGQLNTTKQTVVIQVLERRANRYTEYRSYEEIQDQNVLDTAIYETRTIDGTGIHIEKQDIGNETKTNDSILNERMTIIIKKEKWKEMELEEVRWVDDYLLKVHEVAPEEKENGIVRLMYENLNGLDFTLSGNNKLERERQIIDDMEADIVA